MIFHVMQILSADEASGTVTIAYSGPEKLTYEKGLSIYVYCESTTFGEEAGLLVPSD